MIRRFTRMLFGLSAVAIIAMASTAALAGDLGIVRNGDIERVTRFLPHGVTDVPPGHPGFPDAWHHSANSSWSNVGTDPVTSGIHSLRIPDERVGDHDEMRSFATPLPSGGNLLTRTLDLSWNWNWDITSALGDQFSATVRISKSAVGGLDLGGAITDHVFLTGGAPSSGGYVPFMTSIPLAPDDRSFDIIFRTRDNAGDSSELGMLFVDDVSGTVPEPATMALVGLGGLGLMMASRRRRG